MLRNGCEIGIFSHIKIIETNHSQLFRYFETELASSLEHTQCLEIRRCKNSRRWLGQIQQFFCSLPCLFLRIWGKTNKCVGQLDSGFFESLPKSI